MLSNTTLREVIDDSQIKNKLIFLFEYYFFFQAEDGIRDHCVTGVQTVLFRSGQPDYALGSVHAVTWDGTLVIASAASHSQLATYAWGRGQCHLHGRRAEAGAHPGSR